MLSAHILTFFHVFTPFSCHLYYLILLSWLTYSVIFPPLSCHLSSLVLSSFLLYCHLTFFILLSLLSYPPLSSALFSFIVIWPPFFNLSSFLLYTVIYPSKGTTTLGGEGGRGIGKYGLQTRLTPHEDFHLSFWSSMRSYLTWVSVVCGVLFVSSRLLLLPIGDSPCSWTEDGFESRGHSMSSPSQLSALWILIRSAISCSSAGGGCNCRVQYNKQKNHVRIYRYA